MHRPPTVQNHNLHNLHIPIQGGIFRPRLGFGRIQVRPGRPGPDPSHANGGGTAAAGRGLASHPGAACAGNSRPAAEPVYAGARPGGRGGGVTTPCGPAVPGRTRNCRPGRCRRGRAVRLRGTRGAGVRLAGSAGLGPSASETERSRRPARSPHASLSLSAGGKGRARRRARGGGRPGFTTTPATP